MIRWVCQSKRSIGVLFLVSGLVRRVVSRRLLLGTLFSLHHVALLLEILSHILVDGRGLQLAAILLEIVPSKWENNRNGISAVDKC